jgi:hypothetical protein
LRKGHILSILIVLVVACVGAIGYNLFKLHEKGVFSPGNGSGVVVIATPPLDAAEGEYPAAERAAAKYGSGTIRHITYPADFAVNQEAAIEAVMQAAEDSRVRVVVLAPAIAGSVAAIRRVKVRRPDVVFLTGLPEEAQDVVSDAADLALDFDGPGYGRAIVRAASRMGASSLVYYSLSRHDDLPVYSERRRAMEEECSARGIAFVPVIAVDPMGLDGVVAAQVFLEADVLRQLEGRGSDTAFYTTSCILEESLVSTLVSAGGILAGQCCPGPAQGLPGALGIDLPFETLRDPALTLEAVLAALEERGAGERFAIWPGPPGALIVEALADLAVALARDQVALADLRDPGVLQARLLGMNSHWSDSATVTSHADRPNTYHLTIEGIVARRRDL